jgi:hypothetical protein
VVRLILLCVLALARLSGERLLGWLTRLRLERAR